jgi:sulfoacetaldehyde dehydrogenase
VRAAYSSGTPAIGVGAGNVPVIIDDTADLEDAAAKIKRSKVFDYATSCSSENSVLIQEDIYPQSIDALRRQGGYLLSPQEKEQLQRLMFGPNGKLTGKVTAQPPETIARLAGFHNPEAYRADFFMVEEEGIGPEYPFSGEKLSVVLTVYTFKTFEEALDKVQRLLDYQGAGHSVGIHSKNEQHIQRLAHTAKVARVLVNQAHAFGNGGSFDNGLGFTLTMGAGTWAGNSISENLSYKHFLNTTRLARVIPTRVPTEEQLWGQYVAKHGR